MLSFKSLEEFKSAISEIAEEPDEESKFKWMTSFYPDFRSIQNIYWEAMDEMAGMEDVNEEQYEAFERKYEALYFPRYLDDAGFYIAMTDLDAAFFVNKDYNVMIAGEVVNLRDIGNYEKLMKDGRSYYANETADLPTYIASFYLNSTSMNSVGPQYDSGWKTYGKRRVKLKARRRFKTYSPAPNIKGSRSLFHLEFCFRKKTCFGWCNYKSKSTIKFKVNIPGRGWTNEYVFTHNGFSSHDSEFEYPIKITSDANYTYYTFGDAPCIANIDYRGVPYTLNYSWTMPGCQCKSPRTANPALIIPSY